MKFCKWFPNQKGSISLEGEELFFWQGIFFEKVYVLIVKQALTCGKYLKNKAAQNHFEK